MIGKNPFFSSRTLLFLIVVLGVCLRMYGVDFGLPALYHADEPIVVNHALGYGTGDFNPHFFKIPPLLSYMLFALYGIHFAAGRVAGIFNSADDFAVSFLQDPTAMYLIGRLFSGVFFATLTIIAVYVLAKRLFSKRAGILAAFFLSVAFLHVQNSHYIYVDIPMVFFLVLTCISALAILKKNTPKKYIIAGILAGIAAAMKYNAALVFVVIASVAVFNRNVLALKGIFVSLCAMAITFIFLNPFSLLDLKFFLSSLFSQAGAEYPAGLLYHITYSLREGIGSWLLGAGFLGIALSALKKRKQDLAILTFPIVFYLVLAVFSQPHERYVLPIVPFLLVYAAGLLDRTLKNTVVVFIVAVVLAIPTLQKSLHSDYLFSRQDTRSLAKAWIEKNIPAGEMIAVGHSHFCPRLRQSDTQLKEKYAFINEDNGNKKRRLDLEMKAAKHVGPAYNVFFLKDASVVGSGFLFEQPGIAFSIEELRKNNVGYVIMHIDSEKNLPQDFYGQLRDNSVLIQEFSPYKDRKRLFSQEAVVQTGGPFCGKELFSRERNGYRIQIFQLR